MAKPPTFMLVFGDQRTGDRLAVKLESFLAFSHAIEQDLDRLVSKWSHYAAPRVKSPSRVVTIGRWRGTG